MPEPTELSTADALSAFSSMGLDSGAGLDDSSGAAHTPSAEGASGDHHTSGDSAGAGAPAPEGNDNASNEFDLAPFTDAPGTAGAKPPATPGQAAGGASPQNQGSRAAKLAAITDPALQEHLQRMGNGAFNHFYDIALKMQSGELVAKAEVDRLVQEKTAAAQTDIDQAKSARYFDHEEGYKLTPEYMELSKETQTLSAEQQFWQEQTVNVAQGQPFYWLEVGADGKYSRTGPHDPKSNPQAMGALVSKITAAGNQIAKMQEKMAELPKAHKSQYDSFNNNIANFDKSLFGNVKNPEFGPLVNKFIGNFPKYMHGRPEIKLLANALAAGQLLMNANKQLNQRLSGNQTFGNAMANAAPAPTTGGRASPQNTIAQQVAQIESFIK